MTNIIAGLAMSLYFANAAQFPIPFLPKEQPKKQKSPIPKIGPAPRIFGKFNHKIEGFFKPESPDPSWINMYFSGPRGGLVKVTRPDQDWNVLGPERWVRPVLPAYYITFMKGNAVIEMEIVLDGGGDAFDLAESETSLLMALHNALVARPIRTLYENIDGELIHRADMRCLALGDMGIMRMPEIGRSCPKTAGRAVSFIFLTFHEPRSALAYSPYTVRIRAEYPLKQKKETYKALYRITGFARIVYNNGD